MAGTLGYTPPKSGGGGIGGGTFNPPPVTPPPTTVMPDWYNPNGTTPPAPPTSGGANLIPATNGMGGPSSSIQSLMQQISGQQNAYSQLANAGLDQGLLARINAAVSGIQNLKPGFIPPNQASLLDQIRNAETSRLSSMFNDQRGHAVADLYGRGMQHSTSAGDIMGRLGYGQQQIAEQALASDAQRRLQTINDAFGQQYQTAQGGLQGLLAEAGLAGQTHEQQLQAAQQGMGMNQDVLNQLLAMQQQQEALKQQAAEAEAQRQFQAQQAQAEYERQMEARQIAQQQAQQAQQASLVSQINPHPGYLDANVKAGNPSPWASFGNIIPGQLGQLLNGAGGYGQNPAIMGMAQQTGGRGDILNPQWLLQMYDAKRKAAAGGANIPGGATMGGY